MSGFIQGEARTQFTLFPEQLDDYVAEDNPTRVIDVFIDSIDLSAMGFKRTLQPRVVQPITQKPCLSFMCMVI